MHVTKVKYLGFRITLKKPRAEPMEKIANRGLERQMGKLECQKIRQVIFNKIVLGILLIILIWYRPGMANLFLTCVKNYLETLDINTVCHLIFFLLLEYLRIFKKLHIL